MVDKAQELEQQARIRSALDVMERNSLKAIEQFRDEAEKSVTEAIRWYGTSAAVGEKTIEFVCLARVEGPEVAVKWAVDELVRGRDFFGCPSGGPLKQVTELAPATAASAFLDSMRWLGFSVTVEGA